MAIPIVPSTVTLNIPPTYSPPTTCFPSTPAPTYTLAPEGRDSQVGDRLVIRTLEPQCYPSNVLLLGQTNSTTITSDGQVDTVIIPTASWFSATSCPSGFVSAGGEVTSSLSQVHCCPSGPFTLQSVNLGGYLGCVQTPTMPVTLVNGTSTITLETPTDMPYGISYRSLEIVFMNNETATTSSSETSSTDSNSGLSTGAQAGIGVGVALGVIALLLLGFFFWWRRHKRSKLHDVNIAEMGSDAATKTIEFPGDDHAVHELGPNDMVEVEAQRNSALPTFPEEKEKKEPSRLVELEGDYGVHEAPVHERLGELSDG